MKNKSFVGIDISKNVIDVSIFREDTNIKMFPHEVFNTLARDLAICAHGSKRAVWYFPKPCLAWNLQVATPWTWKNSSRPRITLSVCLVHV